MASSPTPTELQQLLAQVIAGVAGGSEKIWRTKIGPVAQLPIVLHPRSNWSVSPMCGTADHRIIDQAVEVVRAEHPYVG